MPRWSVAVPCLALLLFTACAEDDSGSIQTSVDQAKPINGLDEGETQDLCEDVAAWAEDNLSPTLFQRLDCIGEATSAATESGTIDEAACQSAYDECLRQPAEEVIDWSMAECNGDGLPMCDISVGEYLDCAEEMAALLNSVVNSFSCSRLLEFAQQDEPQYGPACQNAMAQCPEFFGG